MDQPIQESENSVRTWTVDETAFFAALRAGQTTDVAAGIMGLTYAGVYARRQKDSAFDAEAKAANAEGRRLIAAKIAKSLYSGAEKCDADPRFTTAAIFALKNLDPEHWRDQHDISGPGGTAIPITIIQFGQPDEAETHETDPGDSAAGA